MVESTMGKGRVEAARLDRNPEKLNTRSRHTAEKCSRASDRHKIWQHHHNGCDLYETGSTQVYVSHSYPLSTVVFAKQVHIFGHVNPLVTDDAYMHQIFAYALSASDAYMCQGRRHAL